MKKVLGLSGGADSVFLFHELWKSGEPFRCVYVNHKMNIHDEDSERFCRELCSAYSVQLKVIDVNRHLKNETQAREARYQAFREDVKTDLLILGHHVDDVVETMLMNLCKGTSLNGMSGIVARGEVYGIQIHRPLIELGMTRNKIKASLKQRSLDWFEDETNQDNTILRNRFRNEVIPLLEDILPDCVEKMVDFSEDCKFASDILSQEVSIEIDYNISTQKRMNGTAMQRFWFFDVMRKRKIMVSKRHYKEFVAFIGNDNYTAMNLPNNRFIRKTTCLATNERVIFVDVEQDNG